MSRGLMTAATALLLLLFWIAAPSLALEPGRTGVVILHGKHGNPGNFIARFAGSLTAAGFLVSAPEMSWSRRRGYDLGFLEALAEIDQALADLKARGASRVVLAGHSLGANAALAYAARHPGLDGLVCLAPGHSPEQGKQRDLLAGAVVTARGLVAEGRPGEPLQFLDMNVGKPIETTLPAGVFLSYFDPQGPAVMPTSAAMITTPLPVLWVVGSRDIVTRPPSYAFERAAAHPASRYVVLDADHIGTVEASTALVLEWLRGL